jgi:homoserine dehydrogenase
MEDKSLTFQKGLLEAQQKGYAESDPSNDIEGLDTGAKMVIIANWVMKRRITLHDMEITGISNVTPERLKRARISGSRLKLVGRLSESEKSVRPEKVPLSDSICVPDTLNALTFSTEHAGHVTLIGQGAGGEQTASAIIRDLVDIRQEYKI